MRASAPARRVNPHPKPKPNPNPKPKPKPKPSPNVEQALAKQDAVVSDPEQAALFFVPVMVMQMVSNLWHPYKYLEEVKEHLVHAYPYWNRSQGRDHVFQPLAITPNPL